MSGGEGERAERSPGEPIGTVSIAALSRALCPSVYVEDEKLDEAAATLVRTVRVEKYARIVAAYRPHAMALRARRVWDRRQKAWVREPDTVPALAVLLRDPQAHDDWMARLSGRVMRKAA